MDRFTRNLGHEKQGRIKSVVRPPEYHDGKNGDIQIYNGRLYIKDNNVWYNFIPKIEIINKLTDDTGGTVADIIPDSGGAWSDAEINNAIASLSAKINKIIDILQLDIK